MAKNQNKTIETAKDVQAFLQKIADETRKADCMALTDLMQSHTGFAPKMWGPGIVGFGSYHYKYDSGREGDAPLVAFAPRASSIAIYLSANFDQREKLLSEFGKHKAEKGCIHIKKMADIDTSVLQKMMDHHIRHMHELYPG